MHQGCVSDPGALLGHHRLSCDRHTLGAYLRANMGEVTASFKFNTSHYAVPFYDFLYKGEFNDPNSSSRLVQGFGDVRWDHPWTERFSTLMYEDMAQLDILGSWRPEEYLLCANT